MRIFEKLKNLFTWRSAAIESPKFIIKTTHSPFTPNFTRGYNASKAEDGKFAHVKNPSANLPGYPADGQGKYVMLTYDITDLNSLNFSKPYNPAVAENGKFVPVNLDPSTGYPPSGDGRYAILTYSINSPYLSISGGTLYGDLDMNNFNIYNVNAIYAVSAVTTFIDNITGDVNIEGNVTVEENVTINGNVTATTIYSDCGNSDEWCSAYTTVCANSASWGGSSNFCNEIVYLNEVSACNTTISITGNLDLNNHSISGIANDSLTFISNANIKSDTNGSVFINASQSSDLDDGGMLGFYAASGVIAGGSVEIFAGHCEDSPGADVSIAAGNAYGEGFGGNVIITAGAAGEGGDIRIVTKDLGLTSDGTIELEGVTNIHKDTSITGNLTVSNSISSPSISATNFTVSVSSGGLEMNDSPITNLHYIDWDLQHSLTPAEGRMSWNEADGTIDIGLKGGKVNLQVGQEEVVFCRNNGDAPIPNGSVVYITSADGPGKRPLIGLANANIPDIERFVLGLATEPISATGNRDGYVTTHGLVRDLDTSFLDPGDIIYLNTTTGGITSVPPPWPAPGIRMGLCIDSNATTGVVYVNPRILPVMSKAHDVTLTNPQSGDFLTYTAASGWENTNNISDFATAAQGAKADGVYTTVQANSAIWSGGTPIETETATTFTINTSSGIVLVDATAGAATVNLPNAVGNTGKRFTVKKIDSTSNTVTLSANTNIDGQNTFIINNQYDAIEFISDNAQWWII